MTDLEKQLTMACWAAWKELNAIRARDGVPRDYNGCKVGVDEDYFSSVVDGCEEAVKLATGKDITPWPPELLILAETSEKL